ncbi:HAD hydrolase-like protein [Streptomyces sp. NEAU-H3]|uniref:HAD hydrolase-like protein n=1 Tax=Streptomyces sp. NEAU-H3 TaxID=2720636 RepID=UPI00280BDA9B|nr:HAD hydrolase-like protein [Streptomyces sp. NEAU-H3]
MSPCPWRCGNSSRRTASRSRRWTAWRPASSRASRKNCGVTEPICPGTATSCRGRSKPSRRLALGGYASDDPHRPALVRIAQARAERAHGRPFTRANTVIIGDSLQDVHTGREGGARVVGVASGTASAEALADTGADDVLEGLTDPVRLMEAVRAG